MTDKKTSPDALPAGDTLSPQHEARLDALIGTKLRSYYDELMAEPVPNRILDLLAQLEAKESPDAESPEHKG